VQAILQAVALGQIEFYLPKPARSPDEQVHRAVTESLEEWWRQRLQADRNDRERRAGSALPSCACYDSGTAN
jgi:hypothetical protein